MRMRERKREREMEREREKNADKTLPENFKLRTVSYGRVHEVHGFSLD